MDERKENNPEGTADAASKEKVGSLSRVNNFPPSMLIEGARHEGIKNRKKANRKSNGRESGRGDASYYRKIEKKRQDSMKRAFLLPEGREAKERTEK